MKSSIPRFPIVGIPTAENAGLTGEAAELAARVGGQARHERRVQAAVTAAMEWAGHAESHVHRQVRARVALLLDRVGAFGPHGLGNPGGCSARHPAFAGLGSGRRYARDGTAWDAALQEADRALDGEFFLLRIFPGSSGLIAQGYRNREKAGKLVSCEASLAALPFFKSFIGKVLVHPEEYYYFYEYGVVIGDDNAAAWGSLYNRVLARLEEEGS